MFKDAIRIYNGIFLNHEKERQAIYRYRDGPRDYHTKGSKSEGERQINTRDVTDMWNVKYDTNELICETEAQK